MQIEIIKPGIFSTVQDAGRFGFRDQGVPVSGNMDNYSAAIANLVLGNDANCAVIEFTFAGAAFKSKTDLLISYTGGGAVYYANEQLIETNKPVFLPADTVVSLRSSPNGCRSYLAVAGGWKVPKVMNSCSTYVSARIGGVEGRTLQSGDILINDDQNCFPVTKNILKSLQNNVVKQASWHLRTNNCIPSMNQLVRVVKGAEFSYFNNDIIHNFFSGTYTLSLQSNRMGYRLNGPKLISEGLPELLSTAVMPGTIQVPNGGEPIMLMKDCQTTGGYPRLAQVVFVDLAVCGQLKPGDTFRFQEITFAGAEQLYLRRMQYLDEVRQIITKKYSNE